jgi:quercetin dioxygenase-like cupin family protein
MDEPYFTRPGEGERLDRGYRSGRVLGELPHLEVIELTFEPGFEGVDPHSHPDHTDSFYVLEGEVEFFQDGDWHPVGPGTFLSVPPNVVHGFRPANDNPVRVLNIHAPRAGFIDSLRN